MDLPHETSKSSSVYVAELWKAKLQLPRSTTTKERQCPPAKEERSMKSGSHEDDGQSIAQDSRELRMWLTLIMKVSNPVAFQFQKHNLPARLEKLSRSCISDSCDQEGVHDSPRGRILHSLALSSISPSSSFLVEPNGFFSWSGYARAVAMKALIEYVSPGTVLYLRVHSTKDVSRTLLPVSRNIFSISVSTVFGGAPSDRITCSTWT